MISQLSCAVLILDSTQQGLGVGTETMPMLPTPCALTPKAAQCQLNSHLQYSGQDDTVQS